MPTISLAQYRKDPRPSFYDASTGAYSPISLDMETWLLNQTGLQKRVLISRFQDAIQRMKTNGGRDNLYKRALLNTAVNAGAAQTDCGVSLQNAQVDVSTQNANITEVSKLMDDLNSLSGEALFWSNVHTNTLVASSFFSNNIGDTLAQRKQIQSWIMIITTYITE